MIAAGGPAHLRNVGNSLNGADSLIAFSLNGRELETTPVTQSTRPAQPASVNATEPAVTGDLPKLPEKKP